MDLKKISKGTGISRQGYSILKKVLTEDELIQIKKELTAKPILQGDFVSDVREFPIYAENENKIYVPKYYGFKKFGNPTNDKIKNDLGQDINNKFLGKLRPYQDNIVNKWLETKDTIRGGLISVGCGKGKTVMAIKIISEVKKKTLVVVHKEFLLNQWKERMETFLPNVRIGLIQGTVCDVFQKDVVLCMLQSLSQKDYTPIIFQNFGLVIFDECHHLGAEVFSKALIKTGGIPYTLGLSATPDRKDQLGYVFPYFLGDFVFRQQSEPDKTVLVNLFHYYNDNPEYSQELAMFNGTPNRAGMVNNICSCNRRNKVILEQIKELLLDDRKVLVLSDRREHLTYLENKLEEMGDNDDTLKEISKPICGIYVGGMKQKDLDISEKKRVILGTYSMVSEGFDCPELDSVILASPRADVEQSVGRILRKKPEDRMRQHLVIDIVDHFSSFPNQLTKRKKYYKTSDYKIQNYIIDDNSIKTIIKKVSLVELTEINKKHKLSQKGLIPIEDINFASESSEDELEKI